MKSKISFFNKTIFWKNVNLYWPLWGLYMVILTFVQPILLWISEYSAQDYATYDYGDHLLNFISVLNMEWHIMIIAIGAIMSGMALFHYLYNSKSANMIHSLPVDRTQLFCTNVISGVAFLAVPQLISSILTAIVAISFGLKEIQYIAIWFLMVLGTDIVAFALVTFCAMFTGHIIALPAYVLIVNYFIYWVYYLIDVIVSSWGYGINSLGARFQGLLDLFCPFHAFLEHVGISMEYDMDYEYTGVDVSGVGVILAYLVVSVVLYVVAYQIYRKRHIEQAGEVLTVSWVKPIFRFGVGLTGGFFGSAIICEILHSIKINCGLAGFVIIMLLIGLICYFIADMLIKKSFHVFKKKNWVGCGIFLVLMLVFFFSIFGSAKLMEDYVPKVAEIDTASIDLGYTVQLEGEETVAITAIHEEILKNKEYCEEFEDSGNYYDVEYEHVSITYHLKNGEYVHRSYRLPMEYKGLQSAFVQIATLERDVDNYLTYIFCEDYDKITVFNGGWIEAQFSVFSAVGLEAQFNSGIGYVNENDAYINANIDLTSEQAEALYHAIIADAKAGTLMNYNVYSGWRENVPDIAEKYSDAYLYIEFMDPNQQNSGALNMDENSYSTMFGTTTEIVEYQSWNGAHLNFGPDCENIINTLIELEVIESEKDIWWGEYEE